MDLDIDGKWPGLDANGMTTTIVATLYETTVTIPEAGSQKVSKLVVPLEITGPITDPGIKLDSEKLAQALLEAGAEQLANQVRAEAEKVVDEAVEKGKEEAEKLLDEAIKKGAEEAGEKVGEELKEKVGEELKEKVGEEAEEKAKELIKDLPWGKKKEE
jgi:polyribonucleotide nucleotidyltransferase